MRYATIVLLFCALTATTTATASQQDASDCNPGGLLDQQEGVLEPADFNHALFDEGISHCSQEDLRIIIKMFIVSDNISLLEYNNVVKEFNALVRLNDKLVSSAKALIKEAMEINEENRALKMGQELLLRIQRLRNAIPASPRRELTCKTTTIGMFKTTKCIEE